MKKSRYSEEQVALILREADKAPIAEVAKRHGVSEQSIQLAQALRRERPMPYRPFDGISFLGFEKYQQKYQYFVGI